MAKKKNRILNYFKEVKSELKKVVWPSFKQVKNNTLIVIACVLIIGAFIWILDALFATSLGRVVDKMREPEVVEETATTPDEEQQTITDAETEEYVNSMLEAAGITYNEETQQYSDIETGAVLPEEEALERLNTLFSEETDESTTGETENSTEAPAETTTAE